MTINRFDNVLRQKVRLDTSLHTAGDTSANVVEWFSLLTMPIIAIWFQIKATAITTGITKIEVVINDTEAGDGSNTAVIEDLDDLVATTIDAVNEYANIEVRSDRIAAAAAQAATPFVARSIGLRLTAGNASDAAIVATVRDPHYKDDELNESLMTTTTTTTA